MRAVVAVALLAFALPGRGAQAQEPDSTRVDWWGYVQLFGFAPVDGDGRVELYTLGIGIDVETVGIADQRFGFHGLVRIRDTELREFFDTTVWAQEAYGWWDTPGGRLKAGKVYVVSGRFWDGSFFGNVQYFDGLKLDSDFGLSWEGERAAPAWRVGYAVQWLPDSDGLNGSLAGRDPETFEDVDEREQLRLRVAPAWKPVPAVELGIGGTVGRFELENGEALDETEVIDAAVDLRVETGWGEAYAEFLSRDADPAGADGGELEGDYVLLGGHVRRWGLDLYYNYSRVDYESDASEWIHQPGLAWSISSSFTLLYEFDHWTREEADGARSFVDRSHDVVLAITF